MTIVQRDDLGNVEIKPASGRQPTPAGSSRATAGSPAAACGRGRRTGARRRAARAAERDASARIEVPIWNVAAFGCSSESVPSATSASTRSSFAGSSARSWRTRSPVAPTALREAPHEREVRACLDAGRGHPLEPRHPLARLALLGECPAEHPARHRLELRLAPALGLLDPRPRLGVRGVEGGLRRLIRSSSRAIASDVSTRRPSIFSTGTVLPRKPASRTSTGWRPAGNIVTRCSIPLCSSISRAACPGCESLIEYSLASIGGTLQVRLRARRVGEHAREQAQRRARRPPRSASPERAPERGDERGPPARLRGRAGPLGFGSAWRLDLLRRRELDAPRRSSARSRARRRSSGGARRARTSRRGPRCRRASRAS